MNKIIDIAPLIIFVALILVLLTFLSEKEDQLESVLIDSTFPEFSIASLKDPKRNLSKKDISELPAGNSEISFFDKFLLGSFSEAIENSGKVLSMRTDSS